MAHFIFDCDDVLLNWQDAFLQFLYAGGVCPDPSGPKEWDLSKWIGCSPVMARQLVEDFNSSRAFANLNAMPGMKQAVWGLYDAGHRISVLTCCGDGVTRRSRRVSNLYRAFARPGASMFRDEPWGDPKNIHTLPLGASKYDVLMRMKAEAGFAETLIFIEDSYAHALSGVAAGIETYCLRRCHNRSDEEGSLGSGVIWLDDMLSVLNHFAPGWAA